MPADKRKSGSSRPAPTEPPATPAATTAPVSPAIPVARKSAAELFGRDEPPGNTRDRLIEAALELFYVHGFHAVGLDQIVGGVGISKQAFYKHFESKDDLAVEAIRRRDKREGAAFMARVRERSAGDARSTLLALFDVLDEWFNHPDYQGCLFLTACAEFPSIHDPIHQAAGSHYAATEPVIANVARQAGADDPAALARELTLLLEGAVACRLVTNDNAAARQARRLAALTIDSRLPKQNSAPGPS